jgi:bifunctional DNase/RNase
MTDVEMEIDSVRTDVVSRGGVEAGRVDLVETDGDRRLAIVIGRSEAKAIDDAMSDEAAPRPLAWDLLRNVVDAVGGSIPAVVITDVEHGRIFRAEIVLAHGGVEHHLPARPSDALALATRSPEARILVAAHVLDAVAGPPDPAPFPER